MPVDDLNSGALNSSSSSTELRAEAREFVPLKPKDREEKFSNGHGSEVNNNNTEDSKRKKKYTGAVPKSSSSSSLHNDENRRNWRDNQQLPPRFQKKQNGNYEDENPRRDDSRESSSRSSVNQKFFKDNQNYYNGNKSSRFDSYNNVREEKPQPRHRKDNQWDRRTENPQNNRNDHPQDRRDEGRHVRRNENRNEQYQNSRDDHQDRRDRQEKRDLPRQNKRSENSSNLRNDRVHEDEQHHHQSSREDHTRRNVTRDNQQAYKKPPQMPRREKKEKSIEPSKISQREQLIKDIESNSLECMICCDKIRDHQPTWSCTNCYHILHLTCIKTWITNSKTESGEWRCVACQFLRKEFPRDYFCFCLKQKYPAVNRNDLAHSCGDMCGRTDNCLHPCTLRCHPGPHAICQSFVQRSCACGKSSKTFQCSMKETFECEDVCEKALNCGVHKCQESCHQGDCKPCCESIEMKCFCGKDAKIEACVSDNALITKYSCDKVCDLPLSCDNHRCELLCHPQKCGSCLLSPELIKACPCGRTKIEKDERKNCSDPIPLCKSQCSKVLKCGPLASPHACTKPCHIGECPPCSKSTNVKCRCGRIEEKIACKDLLSSDVRCKKKCTKFKTCGKHKCNQSCCIEIEHLCSQQCGRSLECKKHRCQRPCHIGNCTPCQRASFEELRCECGAAVVYPPVPCGTRVPDCAKKCARTHKCTHPVSHLCHGEENCPPCVHLTAKFCYGKHEMRKTIPCNESSFSCGMPCGKKLKCGRHNCIKKCHQNECENAVDVCKQPCTVKRDCGHNCNAPCHDAACPDRSCRESMEVACPCGNLKEMKSCEQVSYENRKIQRAKLAMQMQDGDTVEFKDIYGDSLKRSVKILECNVDCETIKRHRMLDIAFKVENPNLINYPKFVPNYTEFIRTFYKKEPTFVKMVHEKLTELVKLAKESRQKSRSYSFPVMNRDKRHAVHDLATMFGVETQAYDAEPNRNVIATASRETVSLVMQLNCFNV